MLASRRDGRPRQRKSLTGALHNPKDSEMQIDPDELDSDEDEDQDKD